MEPNPCESPKSRLRHLGHISPLWKFAVWAILALSVMGMLAAMLLPDIDDGLSEARRQQQLQLKNKP